MRKVNIACSINSFLYFFSCLSIILVSFSKIILAESKADEIVIIHTNDIHGNVMSKYKDDVLTVIGMDYIKSVKNNTKNSILVDAGNNSQGSLIGKMNYGADVIALMNAAEYDVSTFGNHEFDIGIHELKKRCSEAIFPFLGANVRHGNKAFSAGINGFSGETFVKEIGGRKIGFIGITTKETVRTTPPFMINGLQFQDEVQWIKKCVKSLQKQKVDAVVLISHVGIGNFSKYKSYDFTKIKGIDCIIDGHSYTKMSETINGVPISQTGHGSSALGFFNLKFKNGKVTAKSSIVSAREIGEKYDPDKGITEKCKEIYWKNSEETKNVAGRCRNTIFGGTYENKNISRMFETQAGDLICDAITRYMEKLISEKPDKFVGNRELPIVAFENGGSIKASINAGYICVNEIYSLLPFDNKLTMQIITPKELYAVLERGVGKLKFSGSKFDGDFGGFPQVSGIKFEFDIFKKGYDYTTNSGGERVVSLFLTDKKGNATKKLLRTDGETKIMFLCNNFTLYKFPAISKIKTIYEGDLLSKIVFDHIRMLTLEGDGIFSYRPHRRIKMCANSKFEKFDAELTISDRSGVLSFSDVFIKIGDGQESKMRTDADGKIHLKALPFDTHIAEISYGGMKEEFLLSSIAGIKSLNIMLSNSNNSVNVANIIGQIPYKISFENENFIKFARRSYNDLTKEDKKKIYNYKKLKIAENEILKLKGSFIGGVLLEKNTSKIFVVVVLFASSVLIFYITKERWKTKIF